jgi:hypothetical protein
MIQEMQRNEHASGSEEGAIVMGLLSGTVTLMIGGPGHDHAS